MLVGNLISRWVVECDFLIVISWCIIVDQIGSTLQDSLIVFTVVVVWSNSSLFMMSPRIIVVLVSTSSIVQFLAVKNHDWISARITFRMSILFLLKHLKSPNVYVLLLFVNPEYCFSRCFFVQKTIGTTVSHNRCVTVFLIFMLIQTPVLSILLI